MFIISVSQLSIDQPSIILGKNVEGLQTPKLGKKQFNNKKEIKNIITNQYYLKIYFEIPPKSYSYSKYELHLVIFVFLFLNILFLFISFFLLVWLFVCSLLKRMLNFDCTLRAVTKYFF